MILGVHGQLNTDIYLGLPSLIGKSTKVVFAHLQDRLRSKTQGWQSKLLSQAGKEVFFKYVA